MTTKKTTAAHRRTQPGAVPSPSAYHRLDALLHTMRCIAQHEDALCELSHELKQAGDLSPEIRDEFRDLLDKIPSQEFVLDLDAVRDALVEPRPSASSRSKESARSLALRKRSAIAKKSPRRKSSR